MKKINKEKFVDFLSLLKLKGFLENTEILLSSNPKHIITYGSSMDKDFAIRGQFYGEFPEKEEVGIAPLKNFISYVKLMDDEFNIEFKINRVHLKSKSVNISTVLKNKDYFIALHMNKLLDPTKFENKARTFDNQFCFTLDQTTIKDIIKIYETVSTDYLLLYFTKKALTIKLKDKLTETNLTSDINIKELKDIPEEFSCMISKKFIDLLGCVKTDLKCYIDFTNSKEEHRKSVLCVKSDSVEYNFCYFFVLNEIPDTLKVEEK